MQNGAVEAVLTPSAVVRAVLDAIAERRWDDVAGYVDPVLLERDYEASLESARTHGSTPVLTAEQLMRHEPDMPREVAEYSAARMARSASAVSHELAHLGLESVDQLAALSPAQYLAAKLRAHYTAEQAWGMVPPEARFYRDLVEEQLTLPRRAVIGEVVDGDIAFVVYRSDTTGAAGMAYVTALRRHHGRWVVQPGGELFGEGWGVSVGWDGAPGEPPAPLAVRQPPWTSRTFEQRLPVELFPGVLDRFRSAPSRATEIVFGVLPSVRRARPQERWSIQEHLGHLLDLETLGEQRLEDFRRRADVLTAADMTNRATHEADHNATPVWELSERFATARDRLADALARLPRDVLEHAALHPRLQRPMTVVEWVFFMCEHDDHHLARMREQAIVLELARRAPE